MRYIFLGKRWAAELEEATKPARLDQAEGLEVWDSGNKSEQCTYNNKRAYLPRLHKRSTL
jgi:hypothetical protein